VSLDSQGDGVVFSFGFGIAFLAFEVGMGRLVLIGCANGIFDMLLMALFSFHCFPGLMYTYPTYISTAASYIDYLPMENDHTAAPNLSGWLQLHLIDVRSDDQISRLVIPPFQCTGTKHEDHHPSLMP
jgi:hypothetical protein